MATKFLTALLLLCNSVVCGQTNDCETTHGGTCINSAYNSCLNGYYYTLSGCGFQEMCCIPPTHQSLEPPLAPGQCGVTYPDQPVASHRIVGGVRTLRGEFPWQVSLRSFTNHGHHMCGGVLISDRWILTAAHCFQSNKNPFAWNGILGEYDRGVVDGHEKLVKVDTLIVHSSFNSVQGGNDIAMLRIATSNVSMYTHYVRPACLPEKTESFQHLTCTITGWGAAHTGGYGTRYLYKASVPLLSNEVCSYLMDRPITEGELCAGEKMGGVDACQGDSGGPMVCFKDGVWKLAGITSWGYGCANSFSPGVYTKVAYYRDWINTVMQYYTNAQTRRGLEAAQGLHYV